MRQDFCSNIFTLNQGQIQLNVKNNQCIEYAIQNILEVQNANFPNPMFELLYKFCKRHCVTLYDNEMSIFSMIEAIAFNWIAEKAAFHCAFDRFI